PKSARESTELVFGLFWLVLARFSSTGRFCSVFCLGNLSFFQRFPPRQARMGRAYRSAELCRIGKPAGRGCDSLDCRAGFWLVLARSGSVCSFWSVLWLGNLSLSQGFPRAYRSAELPEDLGIRQIFAIFQEE